MNYEILKHIRTMGEGSWKLELNVVSWYGKAGVYDLRRWNEDHTRAGKGITLTVEEVKELLDIDIEEL